MQKLFDSPVMDELTQKQQDLLVTLVEEAPQKKIDALKQKLLQSETTVNRQHYLVACLNAFGKPDALAVVEEFKRFELSKGKQATCVKYDPLGAEYICIPAGKFIYSETKQPKTVPDLYFAKYTVTNQQYRRFIRYLEGKEVDFESIITVQKYKESLIAMASGVQGFTDYLEQEQSLAERFRSTYDDDRKLGGDDQPVVGVSWYAARAYCLWLSLLASNGKYRLPMDAEWEWAAGGQRDEANKNKVLEVREYPWGKGISPQHANYNGNEGATTPVGRYPKGATPEGLYDMAGNVWEWIEDLYSKTGSSRVLRGGSWRDLAEYCRSANRGPFTPDSRYDFIGFRLVFVP